MREAEAITKWHAKTGKPLMHPDVVVGPLLNLVVLSIRHATDCPGCRLREMARAISFLTEALDDLDVAHHGDDEGVLH